MTAALLLEPHHTTAELWTSYRSCRDAVEQRRLQAIAFLSEGRSPGEVRHLTRLSPPVYAKIVKAYNAHGLVGLRDGRQANPGRPPRLSDQQLLLLVQTVRHDYAQGLLWDAPKMQAFVEDLLGAPLHPRRAYELLELTGLAWLIPRPAHVQADPVAQHDFKKNVYLKRLRRLGFSPPSSRSGAPMNTASG